MATTKIGAAALALAAGIQKHFPSATQVTLGGVSYAPSDLVTLLQSVASSAAATATAKSQWLSTAKVSKANATKAASITRSLRAYVRAVFGLDPAVLIDFGLSSAAAKKPSVKIKAQADDLKLNTRAARHTLGKRQKLAIKGTVPATPATSNAPKT
jgi:hypothetical protein